ncbi:hypothetical protein C5D18_05735 [Rathayibacter tritici]|nr:hypothetical protein C5D18_05735 [Rathayibacter tritici]
MFARSTTTSLQWNASSRSATVRRSSRRSGSTVTTGMPLVCPPPAAGSALGRTTMLDCERRWQHGRMAMDPDEALLLDALLSERQAGMRLDMARLEASLVELLRDRADGTADDEHDPEGTPLSAEWSRMAGVRDALVRTSRELDGARARLGRGEYGDCASCGRPVGAARLTARPTAELCIACARQAESRAR